MLRFELLADARLEWFTTCEQVKGCIQGHLDNVAVDRPQSGTNWLRF